MTEQETKDLCVALRAARCIGNADSPILRSKIAEEFRDKMQRGGYDFPLPIWEELLAIASGE